jgi:hypothetical protein
MAATTARAGAHAERTCRRDQRAFGDLGGLGGGFDLRSRPRSVLELLTRQRSRTRALPA